MADGFANHDDMIHSVCDGFTNGVNYVIPENLELLCNQDGYEILAGAFGAEFRKHDIENATIDHIRSIASELSEFLERDVSVEEVCGLINAALKQSFGDFTAVEYKT
jgi:hypothetical protein